VCSASVLLSKAGILCGDLHVRFVPILLQKSAISEVSGKPIVFEVVGF
jgi:hypothetical protein